LYLKKKKTFELYLKKKKNDQDTEMSDRDSKRRRDHHDDSLAESKRTHAHSRSIHTPSLGTSGLSKEAKERISDRESDRQRYRQVLFFPHLTLQSGGIYKDSRDSKDSSSTDYFKKPFQQAARRHDDEPRREERRDDRREDQRDDHKRSTWDVTPTHSRPGTGSGRSSSSRSDASPFRRSSSTQRGSTSTTAHRSGGGTQNHRMNTVLEKPDERADDTAYIQQQQDLDRDWYMFEEGNAVANAEGGNNLFSQDQAHWEKKEEEFKAKEVVC
jgi:hypothetical protein